MPPMFNLKAGCWVFVFRSVGDRDVADAAYRDVFTAVLKTNTQCLAATDAGPKLKPGPKWDNRKWKRS